LAPSELNTATLFDGFDGVELQKADQEFKFLYAEKRSNNEEEEVEFWEVLKVASRLTPPGSNVRDRATRALVVFPDPTPPTIPPPGGYTPQRPRDDEKHDQPPPSKWPRIGPQPHLSLAPNARLTPAQARLYDVQNSLHSRELEEAARPLHGKVTMVTAAKDFQFTDANAKTLSRRFNELDSRDGKLQKREVDGKYTQLFEGFRINPADAERRCNEHFQRNQNLSWTDLLRIAHELDEQEFPDPRVDTEGNQSLIQAQRHYDKLLGMELHQPPAPIEDRKQQLVYAQGWLEQFENELHQAREHVPRSVDKAKEDYRHYGHELDVEQRHDTRPGPPPDGHDHKEDHWRPPQKPTPTPIPPSTQDPHHPPLHEPIKDQRPDEHKLDHVHKEDHVHQGVYGVCAAAFAVLFMATVVIHNNPAFLYGNTDHTNPILHILETILNRALEVTLVWFGVEAAVRCGGVAVDHGTWSLLESLILPFYVAIPFLDAQHSNVLTSCDSSHSVFCTLELLVRLRPEIPVGAFILAGVIDYLVHRHADEHPHHAPLSSPRNDTRLAVTQDSTRNPRDVMHPEEGYPPTRGQTQGPQSRTQPPSYEPGWRPQDKGGLQHSTVHPHVEHVRSLPWFTELYAAVFLVLVWIVSPHAHANFSQWLAIGGAVHVGLLCYNREKHGPSMTLELGRVFVMFCLVCAEKTRLQHYYYYA
jgi:hypothetical protein